MSNSATHDTPTKKERVKILLLIDGHGCTLHNDELITLDPNWTVLYRALPGNCPVADEGNANRIMFNSLGFQNHKYVNRNDKAGNSRETPVTQEELRRTTEWCKQIVSGMTGTPMPDGRLAPTLIRDMSFIRDKNPDTWHGMTGGFENTATWYGMKEDTDIHQVGEHWKNRFFEDMTLNRAVKLSEILGQYEYVLRKHEVDPSTVFQLFIYINTCRSMCYEDYGSTPEIILAGQLVQDHPPEDDQIDFDIDEIDFDDFDTEHDDIGVSGPMGVDYNDEPDYLGFVNNPWPEQQANPWFDPNSEEFLMQLDLEDL